MYIHNKQIAVQTSGIRYIQKLDGNMYTFGGPQSKKQFGIRVKYKAAELVEYFERQEERDEFYDNIIKALR